MPDLDLSLLVKEEGYRVSFNPSADSLAAAIERS
jgi:hypothetical protein